MTELHGIPVPSTDQIIIGAELVFILYPVKRFAGSLDQQLRRERNRIIKNHVKTGHEGRLKHCADTACASLRSSGRPRPELLGVQPEVLDLDLQ